MASRSSRVFGAVVVWRWPAAIEQKSNNPIRHSRGCNWCVHRMRHWYCHTFKHTMSERSPAMESGRFDLNLRSAAGIVPNFPGFRFAASGLRVDSRNTQRNTGQTTIFRIAQRKSRGFRSHHSHIQSGSRISAGPGGGTTGRPVRRRRLRLQEKMLILADGQPSVLDKNDKQLLIELNQGVDQVCRRRAAGFYAPSWPKNQGSDPR